MKTLSIVIPAYNEEDTIGPCLESCVAQTVPAHEIIVVNNKSTDGTEAVIHELGADGKHTLIVFNKMDRVTNAEAVEAALLEQQEQDKMVVETAAYTILLAII